MTTSASCTLDPIGVLGPEPHQLLRETDVPVVVIPLEAGARLLHAPLETVDA
jgi:hypothetical protein